METGGDNNPVAIIDGSYLEGGGQILRIASSLSTILGIPVKIHSIRAGRSKPGLRPQHLTGTSKSITWLSGLYVEIWLCFLLGLNLIKDLCNGTLEGGSIGSTEVTLFPGKIGGGEFAVDTITAGY